MKRYIHASSTIKANSQIGTYNEIAYGIEDSGDQRYYFVDKRGQVHYADLEDELFAEIDDYLDSQNANITSAKNSYHTVRKPSLDDKLREEWYTADAYPEVDPARLAAIFDIDWNDVTAEDSEIWLEDESQDLSAIKSIRYFTHDEQAEAEDLGYDGGYVVTYKDGSIKTLAWLPYPHNLDGMEEIDIYSTGASL